MGEALDILLMVGIIVFATWMRRENMDELKKALKVVLNNNVSVYGQPSKDGYRVHLYKSGNSYDLLKFEPKRADLLMDEEESFDDVNDAIAKFLQKIDVKGTK